MVAMKAAMWDQKMVVMKAVLLAGRMAGRMAVS
jgi:hypothetical protein